MAVNFLAFLMEPEPSPPRGLKAWRRLVLWPLLVAALCTALGWLLMQAGDVHLPIMLYVIGVMVVALRWGRAASSAAALASILGFDYFLEEGRRSFAIQDWQHLLLLVGMLGIAQLVSYLVDRMRTQTVLAQKRELEAVQERTRSSLLSAISHDLRTPLAAVRGAATTLASEGEGLSREERQELTQMIQTESQRLEHLLANVLEVTRLQAGARILRKEPQDLQEILGAALNRLEGAGGEAIGIDLSPDLPLVPMDGSLMEQVLLNLFRNSLLHAPGAAIRFHAGTDGEDLAVEVEDDGPGIPQDVVGRIFEKFVRGPSARPDGGTGLGLAICHAIIRAHGGDIKVMLPEAGGTRFRFTIPLSDQGGG